MRVTVLKLCLVVFVLMSPIVFAQGFKVIMETLTGYEEVPAVSTVGNGQFRARISNDETSIQWELSYSNLEGAIQQSHIHLGQPGVNGGISVFLCTNLGNGPVGIQACPAPPATISGTINASEVSPNIPATAAARTQGLDTGEIAELIRAMRAGATYVNIHTVRWPGGEVRKQINGNSGKN
jgi:CHRD domain-containing protein